MLSGGLIHKKWQSNQTITLRESILYDKALLKMAQKDRFSPPRGRN